MSFVDVCGPGHGKEKDIIYLLGVVGSSTKVPKCHDLMTAAEKASSLTLTLEIMIILCMSISSM